MKTSTLTKPVFVLLVMSLLALQGCGTPTQYHYTYQPSGIAPAFTLVDDRPAKDLTFKNMSLIITSENYGIFRFAENDIVPNKIAFLRNRLSTQQPQLAANSYIRVKRFAVYNNLQQMIKRNNNIGFLTGPVGVVGDITLNPGELPAEIIAEIEFTLNAANTQGRTQTKTCSAKTSVPYVLDKKKGPNKAEVEIAIKAAMQQAIDQAIHSCL